MVRDSTSTAPDTTSPTYQRFIAQDPLDFKGGDFNLYGYVSEDPTDLTDPSGQGFLDCAQQIANLLQRFDTFWRRYQERQNAPLACRDRGHQTALNQAAQGLRKQAATTGRACQSPILEAILTLLEALEF